MQSAMMSRILGRPVKDVYGRYVGYVIGLSIDTLGQLKSVGVDRGMGSFTEYPVSRVVFEGDSVVVIPEWKLEAENLAKERAMMQKRTNALEELRKSGEISQKVYEELYKQYMSEFSHVQSSYENLMKSLEKRVSDLDAEREGLEKFLAKVKVQYRSGEIDGDVYNTIAGYVSVMMERNKKEKEEILETLGKLSEPKMGEVVVEQEIPTLS